MASRVDGILFAYVDSTGYGSTGSIPIIGWKVAPTLCARPT